MKGIVCLPIYAYHAPANMQACWTPFGQSGCHSHCAVQRSSLYHCFPRSCCLKLTFISLLHTSLIILSTLDFTCVLIHASTLTSWFIAFFYFMHMVTPLYSLSAGFTALVCNGNITHSGTVGFVMLKHLVQFELYNYAKLSFEGIAGYLPLKFCVMQRNILTNFYVDFYVQKPDVFHAYLCRGK